MSYKEQTGSVPGLSLEIIDNSRTYSAVLENLLTGEKISVTSTTDHPCSSYGQSVWVDGSGNCYGQCNLPIIGYGIISLEVVA